MLDAQKKLEYLDAAVGHALGNLGSKLARGRIPTPADARALKLLREVIVDAAVEDKARELAAAMVRPLVEQIKSVCYAIVAELAQAFPERLDAEVVARYHDALTERLDVLAGEER